MVKNEENFAEKCVQEFQTMLPEAVPQQIQFARSICNDMYYYMRENDGLIRIVPARCGFGKGTVQKAFLKNVMNEELIYDNIERPLDFWGFDYNGVIYVTDRLERLEKIYTYLGNASYYLRSEKEAGVPVYTQMEEQINYPILLMTTQRYFQMEPSQIGALRKWKYGSWECERTLVIFDEKPYFYEQFDIDIDVLNDIAAELNALPESVSRKDEIIKGFHKLNEEINMEWSDYTRHLRDVGLEYEWVKAQEQQENDFLGRV